jgi:hypothetical protein
VTRSRQRRPYRALTTFSIVVTGIVVLLAGIALLYVGGLNTDYWKTHQGLQALVNNLGALLVISVALSAVWELVGKRAFTRELLETNKTAADVQAAGLRRIVTDYLDDPDWDELFRGVRNLDIFVAYGQTWRNLNFRSLRHLADRSNGCIRVYLPDPNKKEVINVLAERFEMSESEVVKHIADTKAAFEALGKYKATVEVYYYGRDRLFSFYVLDGTAVVTLYGHKKGRTPTVPTFVCRGGGSLYDFIDSELKSIHSESQRANP